MRIAPTTGPSAAARRTRAAVLTPCLALLLATTGDAGTVCHDTTGERDGLFHTFWHDDGEGCLALLEHGYQVRWTLGRGGNLVAGRGWRHGSSHRVVGYRIERFDSGTNGQIALYGWSTRPLVEYYVVDTWGSFTPPGPEAVPLGTVRSDGATYRIFRARRIQKPSIVGVATFDQYWSVRTAKRHVGESATITFANHVAAWRRAGMILGKLDYQVLATEGFGSTGSAAVRMDGETVRHR